MKTVINVKVADLKLHKSYSNIYTTKSKQLELLVDSIKETKGILSPIVINSRNEIINGVQRWLAYKQLNKALIPAIVLEGVKPADEVLYIISYNVHKEKTMLERWQEIQTMKKLYGKRQGERTDLKEDSDNTSTRKKIALHMNISEGNVYKIEKIAEFNKSLFTLIDAREISLHEAYERIPKSKLTANAKGKGIKDNHSEVPTEVISCQCPKCGHLFKN
jgi:hypothetical protein